MDNPKQPYKRRLLGLWVTEQEYADFGQEAAHSGFKLSGMLRFRIFGTLKGLRVVRRPSVSSMLLLDTFSRVKSISIELNKMSTNLSRIAEKLDSGSRDLFGLDSNLRLLEKLNPKIQIFG